MGTLEARSGPSSGYFESSPSTLKEEYEALIQEEFQQGGFPPDDDPLDGLEVSEEDYWEFFYQSTSIRYEWNNGFLERVPVTKTDGFWLYEWFWELLREYIRTHESMRCTGLDIGFRVENEEGEVQIRMPDLGLVVLDENPVEIKREDTRYQGIFDLCIEALSYSKQSEIDRDVITKKQEYEQAGVREYFILDDRHEETAFYHLNDQGKYEPIPLEDGDIIRSTVLPQFAFRLSHLKQYPRIETLVDDPIYSPYVLLSFQKERAEKEKERAEKEKERAEKEAALSKAEEALSKAEKERKEKEEALSKVEEKQKEKEKIEEQLDAMKKYFAKQGMDFPLS